MKTPVLVIISLILGAATTFLVFDRMGSAMEVDSLKEHIKLQRKEMQAFEAIMNSTFSHCNISVSDFEKAVRANGGEVIWRGDDALVRAFRVKKKGSCLVSVNVVDGL
jgi:hypothetical protein